MRACRSPWGLVAQLAFPGWRAGSIVRLRQPRAATVRVLMSRSQAAGYVVNEWEYSDAFHLERFRDRLPTGLLSAAQFAEKILVGRQPVAPSPTTDEIARSE